MTLKQFVPSKVCLSCDGCCRYKEEENPWRPKVEVSLSDILLKDTDKDGYIKTVSCVDGLHRCTFLNLKDNTCRIYKNRPFECQLYPFVLTRWEGRPSLCVHLSCPFVQEQHQKESFKEYIRYLKEYFSGKAVLEFLKENPSLVGDYSEYKDELEFVLSLDFPPQADPL